MIHLQIAIIIFLATIILILLGATIYLNIQFYKEKKTFEEDCKVATKCISDSSSKHFEQLHKIKLSEELNKNLKSSKKNLSELISELNYELFDILAKNNLLK